MTGLLSAVRSLHMATVAQFRLLSPVSTIHTMPSAPTALSWRSRGCAGVADQLLDARERARVLARLALATGDDELLGRALSAGRAVRLPLQRAAALGEIAGRVGGE
jgi:hypothetical protein